jgi:carbon-monoxide dehydrogenase small subunit
MDDSETAELTFRVNGREETLADFDVSESLLHVLRERLGLYGTKNACEEGECGSCSVVVDEALVCACLVAAVDVHGCNITTVEAFSESGESSKVQSALVRAGAVQCGFCTPGIVVALESLVDAGTPINDLALREYLSGNLCRCTGYGRILAGAREALTAAGLMSEPKHAD